MRANSSDGGVAFDTKQLLELKSFLKAFRASVVPGLLDSKLRQQIESALGTSLPGAARAGGNRWRELYTNAAGLTGRKRDGEGLPGHREARSAD
jgi:hypothetical protein